jgi:hypothetical protein
MSATESPLGDILAQLRDRVESWGQEAAAARATLMEEITQARRELASEPVAGAHTAQAPPAITQADLDTATRAAETLRAQLDSAEQQIAALNAALAKAQQAAAEAPQAPPAETSPEADALRAELAQLRADFENALAQKDTTLNALRAELAAARASFDDALLQKDAALTDARRQIGRLQSQADRDEAARTLAEKEIPAFDQHGHKRRMGIILVEAGVLTQEQLDIALAEQAANPQRRFGAIAVERGFTTEEAIARILAAQLRLPFHTLAPGSYDPTAARRVSAHLARLHKAVPVQQHEDTLTVAMANPLDLIAIEDIEIASRCRVEPVVATRSAIDAILAAGI